MVLPGRLPRRGERPLLPLDALVVVRLLPMIPPPRSSRRDAVSGPAPGLPPLCSPLRDLEEIELPVGALEQLRRRPQLRRPRRRGRRQLLRGRGQRRGRRRRAALWRRHLQRHQRRARRRREQIVKGKRRAEGPSPLHRRRRRPGAFRWRRRRPHLRVELQHLRARLRRQPRDDELQRVRRRRGQRRSGELPRPLRRRLVARVPQPHHAVPGVRVRVRVMVWVRGFVAWGEG
mmetsp:Transcript_8325/g.23856  ORF Transcript_8325/g.23856 Transcript_8325/m.23856 type:complete len:232 (-) Transcript_8325:133-828(-)